MNSFNNCLENTCHKCYARNQSFFWWIYFLRSWNDLYSVGEQPPSYLHYLPIKLMKTENNDHSNNAQKKIPKPLPCTAFSIYINYFHNQNWNCRLLSNTTKTSWKSGTKRNVWDANGLTIMKKLHRSLRWSLLIWMLFNWIFEVFVKMFIEYYIQSHKKVYVRSF